MQTISDEILAENLKSLKKIHRLNIEQDWRYEVLTACGPYPPKSTEYNAPWYFYARAERVAWDAYLESAEKLGFLEGIEGKELVSKLRNEETENFQSALAECKAIWYLSFVLGWKIRPPQFSSNYRGKKFDIQIVEPFEICAEVKNTWRSIWSENLIEIQNQVDCRDDSEFIKKSLRKANSQFSKENFNLLILVPRLSIPLYSERYQLSSGLIGKSVIRYRINEKSSILETEDNISLKFNGMMLPRNNIDPARYTRISAVLTIEDQGTISKILPERKYWYPEDVRMEHRALVLHNPYGNKKISSSLFGSLPQLLNDGKQIWWSDGHTLHIC